MDWLSLAIDIRTVFLVIHGVKDSLLRFTVDVSTNIEHVEMNSHPFIEGE